MALKKDRAAPRYSFAVLYDPQREDAALGPPTLKHWSRIAEKQGVEVEPITRRDLARLAEFDALFIRETTSIDNHTYRSMMKHPVLLGRKFLDKSFMVDVSKFNLSYKEKRKKSKKRLS